MIKRHGQAAAPSMAPQPPRHASDKECARKAGRMGRATPRAAASSSPPRRSGRAAARARPTVITVEPWTHPPCTATGRPQGAPSSGRDSYHNLCLHRLKATGHASQATHGDALPGQVPHKAPVTLQEHAHAGHKPGIPPFGAAPTGGDRGRKGGAGPHPGAYGILQDTAPSSATPRPLISPRGTNAPAPQGNGPSTAHPQAAGPYSSRHWLRCRYAPFSASWGPAAISLPTASAHGPPRPITLPFSAVRRPRLRLGRRATTEKGFPAHGPQKPNTAHNTADLLQLRYRSAGVSHNLPTAATQGPTRPTLPSFSAVNCPRPTGLGQKRLKKRKRTPPHGHSHNHPFPIMAPLGHYSPRHGCKGPPRQSPAGGTAPHKGCA